MSTNTYVVEYAKTGRASCKNKPCKNKNIPKDVVRVGKVSPNPFSEGDFKTEYVASPQVQSVLRSACKLAIASDPGRQKIEC
jgi:hypothetical protein